MPGMDVEVLVEFVDNGLDRYDISLAVTTATTPPPPSTVDPANTASLTTPLTATQGPIYTGQPSVHAQAQAGDQVVIDLSYDQTKYKAVATASGAITGSLPLSPDKTQVTFTAVNGNVDVVVAVLRRTVADGDPPAGLRPVRVDKAHLADEVVRDVLPLPIRQRTLSGVQA